MGIRVAVVDDNPHVTWEGRVHPVNATFHRFLSAVLDVAGPDGRPLVDRIDHCVPLRPATEAPRTLALDPRLHVVATTPFDGIAGYLRHAPSLVRRNAAILRAAIRPADLVWMKVPASNAPLAAALAAIARVPRFAYVAGRAADVVAGQGRRGPEALAAGLAGRGYDVLGSLVSVGGDRLVVGEALTAGGGVVTSLVSAAEVRPDEDRPWPAEPGRLALAWAGRVADGKGLEAALEAVDRLSRTPAGERPLDVRLALIGDGPARPRLTELAARLGVTERVSWLGYLADRRPYLAALAEADAFVFPSPAEGFPKVILDAMAVGLPVLATPAGSLAELVPGGTIEPVEPAGEAIAAALRRLAAEPTRAVELRRAGTAFAAAHTSPAEAARLVARWQARWPGLPWG